MQKIKLILIFYLSIISSPCLPQEEYLEIPPVIIRAEDKSYIKLDFSEMKKIIPTTTNSNLILQEELKEPIMHDLYRLTPQEETLLWYQEEKTQEEDRKKIHSVVELFCGNRKYLKYRLLQQEKLKSYNKKLPFEYMLLIGHTQKEGEEYASKKGFNREDKNNISLSFNILSKNKRWLCYNTFDYKDSSVYFPYSTQTQIEDINYKKFLTEFEWYLSEARYIKFQPEIALASYSNYNSRLLSALIEYKHKHRKKDYNVIWGLKNILGKLYDTSYNLSRFYGRVEKLDFRGYLTSWSLGIDSSEYNKLSLFFLLDIIYKYKITDEGFIRLELEQSRYCQQEEINDNYIQVNHLKEDENITKSIIARHRNAKFSLYMPLTNIVTINSNISYKNISGFINIEPKDSYIILKDIQDVRLLDYNIDFIYSLSKYLKQIVSFNFIDFINKKIANIPAYKFRLALEYKKEDLFMNLSILYAGDRYKETNKNNKLDNFLLVDSYLSKKITDKISFYLLGKNLLNSSYMLYKEYPGEKLKIEVGIRLKI